MQDLIVQNAEDLLAWIDRGGVILVCGSLEGMSAGVHKALETALGPDRLLELTETGRYRRDVY